MTRLRFLAGSLLVAVALLAALEGALRLAGFSREVAPLVLRFGYPDTREIVDLFRPDARLFWRMRPDSQFDAEFPVRINAAGYRGPLPATPSADDLLRVAVMGDSVAFGGEVAWPELLAERLARAFPQRPVEVLNFGVPGYSVVQGRRQYQDDVAHLRPDVVILAYGWNDHWLARAGLPDAERRFPSRPVATAAAWLSRLRLAQALHAVVRRGGDPGPEGSPAAATMRRVPPHTFRAELTAFVIAVREGGAAALIVALPSGLVPEAVPPYLVDTGFARDGASAVSDHRHYASLAGSVAAVQGAAFMDLQSLTEDGDGRPLAAWFSADGIHPTAAGHRRIAAALEGPVRALLAPAAGSRDGRHR